MKDPKKLRVKAILEFWSSEYCNSLSFFIAEYFEDKFDYASVKC
ncbi:hypothetical protein [Mycoplasmopsis californica]|nr:hypothetical protein [Mycoplasmopsis californica]